MPPSLSRLLLTALHWLHFNTSLDIFFFQSTLFPRVSLGEEQEVEVARVDTVLAFRNKHGFLLTIFCPCWNAAV